MLLEALYFLLSKYLDLSLSAPAPCMVGLPSWLFCSMHWLGKKIFFNCVRSFVNLPESTNYSIQLFIFYLTLVSSGCLVYVVERAKKCLDFTATVHIFHLIFCSIYNSAFPKGAAWWLVNIISLVIMDIIGEYLCQVLFLIIEYFCAGCIWQNLFCSGVNWEKFRW